MTKFAKDTSAVYSVRVDREVKAAIEAIQRAKGLTLSNAIRAAILAYQYADEEPVVSITSSAPLFAFIYKGQPKVCTTAAEVKLEG